MEVIRPKCQIRAEPLPRDKPLTPVDEETSTQTRPRSVDEDNENALCESKALEHVDSLDRQRGSISLDENYLSSDDKDSDEYYEDIDDKPLRPRQRSSFYKRYGTLDHLRDTADENEFLGTGLVSQMITLRNAEQIGITQETPTAVNVDEWRQILDYDFLDHLELVPSDDDLEKEDYKIEAEDWDEMFFKVFATKIRRSKLVLRTRLPKLRKSSRIRSIFMNDGVKLRNVTDDLDKCHRATQRCFNFQRYSYIICSEKESGSLVEEVTFRGRKYSFKVDRFSAINTLCLWDFNSFWNIEKDFQVATDTSPYLSMMGSQWKDALKADRIGRWIMMYEAAAVDFLKNQGETARARAEDLKDIHSSQKMIKLLLTEYITTNKSSLKNGMVVKGREIVKFLSMDKMKEEMFAKEVDLRHELETCDYLLNPEKENWQDMLSDGVNMSPHGFEQRMMKKTVFLCDPIHWTMCLHVLLEEKVSAMEQFLMETIAVKQKMGTTQKTSKITYTRDQVQEEMDDIKKFISPLPKLKDLRHHIFLSSRKFIKTLAEKNEEKSFGLFGLSGVVSDQNLTRNKSRMSVSLNLALRLGSRSQNSISYKRAQSSVLSKRSSGKIMTMRQSTITSSIKRKR